MNVIDKAVTYLAPERALRRAAARQALKIVNSGYGNYGANRFKKSMIGWSYGGGSSKEDIEDNIDTLRQRSRDAYMGVPIAAGALKALRTNVLASGLTPSPQVDGEFLGLTTEQTDELQQQIQREFSLWADTNDCDADGVDNFYRLQQLIFLGFLMNGDAFAVLGMEQEPGVPYELKIRVIEADRVCSPGLMDRLFPCEVDGYQVYKIVQGIETNEAGKVVAYWICSEHPHGAMISHPDAMKWTRVEARGAYSGRRNVLFVMARERAGQLRGVPILAPVIESIKQLGRYTEAEITAAVISNLFTAFVTPESVSNEAPFAEMIPPELQIDAQDQGTIEMAPGGIVSLAPGEQVTFADPKHPNAGFPEFSEAFIKQICTALEVPPEVLYKMFGTSFSASRGALNEFWRVCQMYRDWLSEDFCQPVYEEWFSEAVAKGRINAPGYFTDPAIKKAYTNCNWNGPARTNLNPVDEVQAAVMRVNAGYSTAVEETAQMTGGDWNRNIKQRLIEAEKKKAVDEMAMLQEPEPEPQQSSTGGDEDNE